MREENFFPILPIVVEEMAHRRNPIETDYEEWNLRLDQDLNLFRTGLFVLDPSQKPEVIERFFAELFLLYRFVPQPKKETTNLKVIANYAKLKAQIADIIANLISLDLSIDKSRLQVLKETSTVIFSDVRKPKSWSDDRHEIAAFADSFIAAGFQSFILGPDVGKQSGYGLSLDSIKSQSKLGMALHLVDYLGRRNSVLTAHLPSYAQILTAIRTAQK